jgi:hypothetical protein
MAEAKQAPYFQASLELQIVQELSRVPLRGDSDRQEVFTCVNVSSGLRVCADAVVRRALLPRLRQANATALAHIIVPVLMSVRFLVDPMAVPVLDALVVPRCGDDARTLP